MFNIMKKYPLMDRYMHGWRYGGARKKAHKKDQRTPVSTSATYVQCIFKYKPFLNEVINAKY